MIGKIAPERSTEQRIPMRYDEFQTRIPENTRAEWTNGEAILLMPPNIRHQDIVAFLLILLRLFVDMKQLGKALGAPCEMRLVAQDSAREPDILFVARANLTRLTAQRLVGPADLVVEVVSDESATRDRVEKWQEYQAAGVREYWIVDPRPGKPIVEAWGLDDTGQYRPIASSVGGTLASSVLPGFWLDRTWLEAEELPNPLTCFVQIAGPDTLRQALG